jgi:phytoene/squalene synthetase
MAEAYAARADFHEHHLVRVSRSFAYGISRLETRLKAQVGLGYLLCRLLDTVEDAQWENANEQDRAFEIFDSFMMKAPSQSEVNAWRAKFPQSINEGETLLLNDAHQVFSEFHSQGERERSAMLEPILSMSAGMRRFTEQTRSTGVLKLRSNIEANAYCLFVAGVVGEMLTGLLNEELSSALPERSWTEGCHFGLFLQKINLLKDQFGDEREGRYLVPDRDWMLQSVRHHADHALEYILLIPAERTDYRLFCAWALYLGLATLPLIEGANEQDSSPPKLSRTRALFLGSKIEFAISNDEKLRDLYRSLLAETSQHNVFSVQTNNQAARDTFVLSDVLNLYQGQMSQAELIEVLNPDL